MGYVGFRQGLSSELIKLVGIISGFFLSFRYYQALGDALAEGTFLPIEWAAALGMAFLVVGMYLLFTRALRLLQRLIQVSFQARLNQVGGLLAGVIRAGLVASVVLVVLQQLPSAYLILSIEERSLSGRTLSRFAPAVYDSVSPLVGRFLTTLRG